MRVKNNRFEYEHFYVNVYGGRIAHIKICNELENWTLWVDDSTSPKQILMKNVRRKSKPDFGRIPRLLETSTKICCSFKTLSSE